MKMIKPAKAEWRGYFIIIPLLAFLMNGVLFGQRLLQDKQILLLSVPLVFFLASISWWCRSFIMHQLRHRFPLFSQTAKRLILLAITHIVLVTLSIIIIFSGYDYLGLFGYQFQWHQFTTGMVLALTITLISTTFWETDYTFKKWKESLAEKEQLEQLTIRHEF